VIRLVCGVVVLAVIALGAGMFIGAGRAPGPTIEIHQPTGLFGRVATFEASIDPMDGELTQVDAVIEQNGASWPLFSLTTPDAGQLMQETQTRVKISREITRETHAELAAGPATIVVRATRSVLYGLRERESIARVAVEARFDPPRLSVVSSFHYVNHGGAELIVYRVTPPDAESGVRVGERFFPGYPAAAAGVAGADDATRVALFALLHDQDLTAAMRVVARDAAGNEAEIEFDHRVFPKQFRRSRIPVSDRFLQQVVPDIVARSEEFRTLPLPPEPDLLAQYLAINGGLRRINDDRIISLAADTSGQEVDQQIHLGFDLASTANAPILASNGGRVIWADYLGIYGDCVIVDHGMGLQSLYAHLSSIVVSAGDTVVIDEQLGLSGRTGLAGGDHLHFAILLHGWPITPMEWWDPHWIEDRITRKLRVAS